MFAASLPAEGWAAVGIIISGCVGAPLVAWINTRGAKRAAQETKDTLGSIPEDHDDLTVVKMLQQVLDGQTGQDNRLAAHDALHASHERRLNIHDDLLAQHAELLRQLRGEP